MTKASGDQGVDLYCTDQSGRACVVQCKRYALHNHVSGPAMRDLIGAAELARADRALFVTTSTFTRDAVNNARQARIEIELIDGSALVTLARQIRATAANPATDGSPDRQNSRFNRLERILAATAAALILTGGIGSAIATHETSNGVAPSVTPPPEAITPTATPASSSQPADSVEPAGAAVNINAQAVRSSPYVAVVENLFATYFDGINTKHLASAASVFAPNGYLGVDHRARLRAAAAATATTHDDDVAITGITPAFVDGVPGLDVRLNFRSRQSTRQGFDGQTCSLWSLNYQLEKVGTSYGLLGPTGNPHPTSCD